MPRTLVIQLPIALLAACTLIWTVAAPVVAAPGVSALVGTPIRSVYVRAPHGGTVPGKPVQVLLALHGMGGNGEDFSKDLIEHADHYGWMIVAPTIDYGDWTKPDQVAREDPMLIRALADYLDQLPQQANVQTRRLVMVLGHSRGAQLAHRFAEFRPDRVLAVAALSAGTYTLPLSSGPQGNMSFPFGVKDLAQYAGRAFDAQRFGGVQFWVGVGGQDTNPNDLPRQWDKYEGTTRVQRAQAFEAAMRQLGARAVLKVFGTAKHDVTSEMRQEACTFLGRAMLPRSPYGTPLAADPIAY
ncbi:MAG TPA: alpha/beta fold hydrolase [Chloroflexota bacterium]|jgi:pimeloyl-ACP methyl ester carboxylesterase